MIWFCDKRERGRGFDREWVGAQYEGQADNLRARGHNTRAPAPGGTIPAVVVLFTRDIEGNTRAPSVGGRPTFYQGQEQYRDSKLERSTSIHFINCKIHQMKKKNKKKFSFSLCKEALYPTKWRKPLWWKGHQGMSQLAAQILSEAMSQVATSYIQSYTVHTILLSIPSFL